jgi:hypothetical protein
MPSAVEGEPSLVQAVQGGDLVTRMRDLRSQASLVVWR